MPAFRDDSVTQGWFTAERWTLGGLLLFTLLVRGGVLWAMRGNLQQDPDAYREIAENLLRHGEFAMDHRFPGLGEIPPNPTAYRPPLYPVVLSNLPTRDGKQVSLPKVAALHLVLGVATVWLTWLTARRVGQATAGRAVPPPAGVTDGGPALADANLSRPTIAPLVAGLLVACDPILLNQQTLVMTETLAAFLAILSLWCLARFDGSRSWFNAALAGGAIGLAALCRPTFLPWLGLVAVVMLFVRGGPNCKSQIANLKFEDVAWRLANVAGLVIAAAAVMSPWAIRNYRVFGKPLITTTHGGYTFYLANNEWFYDWLRNDHTGLPWTPKVGSGFRTVYSFGSTDNEIRYDRWYYAEATRTIQQHPLDFVISCLYRLGQLWSPLPHRLNWYESLSKWLLRYATCVWYCGMYALAAIGLLRIARDAAGKGHPTAILQPPWVWGVLLCFAFTAVHTFYWTNLRMRAPLMPFVAMVAAAGVARVTVRQRDGGMERVAS